MISRRISEGLGQRIGRDVSSMGHATALPPPDNILTLDNGDLLTEDDGDLLENA